MNILHITTYLQGGAGKIIKDISFFQNKAGNNIFVVTTDAEEAGYCNYKEYIDFLMKTNIKVTKVDSTFKRDIYLNLKAVDDVRNIIINEDIDIIHAHAAVPAMIGIIARAGMGKYIPVIQTMHGWGTNKRLVQENMDVTIMNGLDKIVSVSKSDKQLMVSKGISCNKITTIYNGIEDNSKNEYFDDEIINDINLYKSNGYIVFGSIGSICKRKNQELLIDALSSLPSDIKYFFVLIGEGEDIISLQNKVKKYKLDGKVKFYNYRKDANKYIKLFDYLLFTSISEGFSITVLEGFRERVPIIASDINAFTECIENNKTGYLFESESATSLSELLLKIKDKNWNTSVIENAYKKFKNEFTLMEMMKKYDELYINILELKG